MLCRNPGERGLDRVSTQHPVVLTYRNRFSVDGRAGGRAGSDLRGVHSSRAGLDLSPEPLLSCPFSFVSRPSPVISLNSRKKPCLRALFVPQFTGTLW